MQQAQNVIMQLKKIRCKIIRYSLFYSNKRLYYIGQVKILCRAQSKILITQNSADGNSVGQNLRRPNSSYAELAKKYIGGTTKPLNYRGPTKLTKIGLVRLIGPKLRFFYILCYETILNLVIK